VFQQADWNVYLNCWATAETPDHNGIRITRGVIVFFRPGLRDGVVATPLHR
jgi:hypothetical protein